MYNHDKYKNGAPNTPKLLTALILASIATPALAIDFEPFQVGAFRVVPDFNSKVTPSGSSLLLNGEKETAELLTFKPKVTATTSFDGRDFSSMFEVQNGAYSAGRLDNFIDWRFENAFGMNVGEKGRVTLRTELFDSHESANDAFRPQAATRYFSASGVNASYERSAWAGRAKLSFDAGTSEKDYMNDAINNTFRDQAATQVGSELKLRVLPGADMLLKYHTRDIKYMNMPGFATLPTRNEALSYVGGTWEGKVGLAGNWKVASGYRQTSVQSFDADPGTSAWETRVRWQPLEQGIVTFDADRSFGNGFNNRPDISSYRYNLEYQWARPLKTSLGGTWSRKTWDALAREDEGLGLQMRMDYAWSSWVDLFVSVAHEQRYSPQNRFDYKQGSLMMGVAASLDRLFGR